MLEVFNYCSWDVLDEFETYTLLHICSKFIITNNWLVLFITFFFFSVLILGFSNLQLWNTFPSFIFINLQKAFLQTLKDNFSLFQSRYRISFLILFFLIMFFNIWGLFPFSFTQTTRLKVVALYSTLFFLTANFVGFLMYGIEWFNLFLPSGVPELIRPLLVIIESISYLGRLVSLTVRLFANMLAGHALVAILSDFLYKAATLFFADVSFIFSGGLFSALISLEFMVAFLQAAVFVLMISIYFRDTISGAH